MIDLSVKSAGAIFTAAPDRNRPSPVSQIGSPIPPHGGRVTRPGKATRLGHTAVDSSRVMNSISSSIKRVGQSKVLI
jgi:hypothetical protein